MFVRIFESNYYVHLGASAIEVRPFSLYYSGRALKLGPVSLRAPLNLMNNNLLREFPFAFNHWGK